MGKTLKSSTQSLSLQLSNIFLVLMHTASRMLAGASAVEVGAANLVDPLACPKIIADLPRAMEKYGIKDLKDIIGGAH